MNLTREDLPVNTRRPLMFVVKPTKFGSGVLDVKSIVKAENRPRSPGRSKGIRSRTWECSIEIGRTQDLVVGERGPRGFMLGRHHGILLPHRSAPEGLEVGGTVRAFVYTDRDGELIATSTTPVVERGGIAALEVVGVADHGAYLDWGLDRDLFVPHGLQFDPLEVGDIAVVAVDIDDQERLFGSARLSPYLENAPWFEPGMPVRALVYGSNERGTLMVVDRKYAGLAYHSETFTRLSIGDEVDAWITEVREDGRIDLALQRNRKEGTEDARDVVWRALLDHDGFLPLHDKSPPDVVKRTLQMSKKRFKKAIGSLYRDRQIRIEPDGIRVVSAD